MVPKYEDVGYSLRKKDAQPIKDASERRDLLTDNAYYVFGDYLTPETSVFRDMGCPENYYEITTPEECLEANNLLLGDFKAQFGNSKKHSKQPQYHRVRARVVAFGVMPLPDNEKTKRQLHILSFARYCAFFLERWGALEQFVPSFFIGIAYRLYMSDLVRSWCD